MSRHETVLGVQKPLPIASQYTARAIRQGGPAGQFWGMEQSPTTSGCEDMQLLSDPLQVCHMESKCFPLHMNPSWLSPGGRKEPPYCVFPIFGPDGNSKQGPGYLSEWRVKMTPPTSPTHAGHTCCLHQCWVPPNSSAGASQGPHQGSCCPHHGDQLKRAALLHAHRCQSTPSPCVPNRFWKHNSLDRLHTVKFILLSWLQPEDLNKSLDSSPRSGLLFPEKSLSGANSQIHGLVSLLHLFIQIVAECL